MYGNKATLPHQSYTRLKRRRGHITSCTIKWSVAEDEVGNLEPSREESVLRENRRATDSSKLLEDFSFLKFTHKKTAFLFGDENKLKDSEK